jgi:hypothetical protein
MFLCIFLNKLDLVKATCSNIQCIVEQVALTKSILSYNTSQY